MDTFWLRLVIAFPTLFCVSPSFAGYAQVQPPPGFSGNSGTGWFYRAPANEAWIGNTVRTAGSLNVGGQAVKMPAAMRLAANAGRFAGRAAFGNPWLFVAAAGVSLAVDYYASHNLIVQDGVWKKRVETGSAPGSCQINGQTFPTIDGCVAWGVSAYFTQADTVYMNPRYESGWFMFEHYVISNGPAFTYHDQPMPITILTTVPAETRYDVLTRQQFEDEVAPIPLPVGVPEHFPTPVEWPVEAPILNPSPALEPQPMRVPTGNPVPIPLPVPNPNNDPQRWREPVVDITPAPTPEDPWRVDLTPRDITNDSPTPSPIGTPAPVTDPNAPPQTDKPPGLCDQYPDILACQKVELGELPPTTIADDRRDMAITPSSGWGPANGSCPAPRTAVVMGKTISMPFTGLCDFANAIRPLIIGMAWLSAALIFMGLGRKE